MSGEHRDKGAMGNYPAPAPAFLFRTEQDMAPEQSKGTDGRKQLSTSLVHAPARIWEPFSEHHNTATTSTKLLPAAR